MMEKLQVAVEKSGMNITELTAAMNAPFIECSGESPFTERTVRELLNDTDSRYSVAFLAISEAIGYLPQELV